ncbi:retrovirus-related pol polyprotein from transposon TNT 1-94 [Tanacetum coccineum]|uniref:Retrovirus-related pol polyprotein from transposon TNT 1-94 n=1 Tax=Tanacetum coccineum TaxID=301880 RepID=A0ABQ5G7S8_9ASTR
MTTLITTTTSNSQMHNDIMTAGSKDRPPMLAIGRYAQIRDDIYSTVDACTTAKEIWIAIERLQQDESLNKQDVKTNLFWEFGKFTLRDRESIESYYSRFYKMMNEMVRNKLEVATMQVNVQFLQQLQPQWSRFVTVVKQNIDLDKESYHKFFDILKQYQIEVNEICAEKLARNANPLALTSSSISHAPTRTKGKEIAKPVTPASESASDEDSNPEQDQRDKDIQKNLALIEKTATVAGYRETVGNQMVQQTRIQCFNCKEYGHFAKECRKPKQAKDYAYHKEKMLLCKQTEKGVPLCAEQGDWLDDTDEEPDEQELEAHYIYMAKIQEILTVESRPTFDAEQLEKVQSDDDYNVFANERQHSDKPDSINNIYVVEKVDSNVILDLSDMCDNDGKDDQNVEEYEDERVMLSNLISNLKLDTDKNKKIQKQLKKENASLTHELKECKSALIEPNDVRDRCRSALHQKEVSYDQDDLANIVAPNSAETLILEEESRSKLNKDKVKPYDYTYQNSLYELFTPQTQKSLDQLYFAMKIRKKMWRKSFVKYKPNIVKNIGVLPTQASISSRI